MRKIKETLRLHYEMGMSMRSIARSLSVSISTVSGLIRRAKALGLSWPLKEDMDDQSLEALLYPGNVERSRKRPEPDCDYIHQELSKKGVTLQLLWFEYKQRHPDGYQYSQFCGRYKKWRGGLDIVMRQQHRAGEKMFVDYAGQTVKVTDPVTGKVSEAQVFIAVLGASSYTYAEASWSQDLPSWIGAHCRAFEFFEGVPEIVTPDNIKAGVKGPDRYEPDLNPAYQDLAVHYGTVVIPARPRRPRDKAKVESAVQVVERWILAKFRNRTFFSLYELNEAIRKELEVLNLRPFQKLEGSRRSLFERLDRPALKPLPTKRYEFVQWKKARVNLDYHIEVDKNYYSVPYAYIHKEVEVRLTVGTVEILCHGQRIASHRRAYGKGRFTTDVSHMPKAHQKHLDRTPSRLIEEAEAIGPETADLVKSILEHRPHPEQGYRSCLGILRLARRYPKERMEAAAKRALRSGVFSYRSLQSILDHGLDRVPLEPRPQPPSISHANVRGPQYFIKEGTASC